MVSCIDDKTLVPMFYVIFWVHILTYICLDFLIFSHVPKSCYKSILTHGMLELLLQVSSYVFNQTSITTRFGACVQNL